MTDTKKVAPKAKKKRVTKPKVEMVNYSIKMVIPTGQYANIQPKIIVKGGSIQEAHDFIAPHMNKLWKEYYLINERRPEVKVEKPTPQNPQGVEPFETKAEKIELNETTPQPPDSSVAFKKATQAIDSCVSIDAFNLITAQVEKSVKLTEEDKKKLDPLLTAKVEELLKN